MSEPIHQLPIERMRKIMQKVMREAENDAKHASEWLGHWRSWKQHEASRHRRQRWLYAFVTATVLALIGWLVSGGCK